MATAPLPTPLNRRRWLLVAGIGSMLLIVYVLALGWAAQRLESGVRDSIRPLSTDQLDHG